MVPPSMPRLRPTHLSLQLLALAVTLIVATLAGESSASEPDRAIDATCAWGRLADGKGRLLRCLSREEATRLRDPAPAATLPAAPPGAIPVPPRNLPVVVPPAGTAPSVGAPASPDAVLPVDPAAVAVESELLAEVGPVVADEGALPDALKNLKKAKDRYVECVDKNGGLTSDRGEVELRFLVQSKGRAEGVSVKKRRGLGEAAAKCVADVVDRRYVGYPEAPAVGASVIVAITKKKR
jgi:hypothetical protein